MSINKNNNALSQKAGKKKYQWTKKKIIAASIIGAAVLSFIIFLTIVLVMQLGPIRPIKSTEEEARVVGTVGGYEVRYEELRYITLLHKQSLNATLGKYDTLDPAGKEEYERQLSERVIEDLKSNYVILTLCDKYGIDTDSKQADNYVQDGIEAFVEESFGGDKKEYKAWLAKNGMTDAFLRLTYKTYYLETALMDHFVENKIDLEYDETTLGGLVSHILASDEWVRSVHAFYPKTSDYIDVSGSADKAQALVEELSAIKDDSDRYSAMRSAIGRAPFVSGVSITGNGVYFTYGQMGEDYETATFELKDFEASEVVETEDGYYVIMRMPKDETHIKAQATTLLSQYRYLALKKHMDAQESTISFEGNSYFNTIDLMDIQ